jgi:hypothetical protein
VALSTLRAGIEAGNDSAAADLSVPSMYDGLDDGNGAWWDPEREPAVGGRGKGGMFPPVVKPTLRDDASTVAIRKLSSPGERAKRRAEPLSYAGKHSKQFYGVEVLEHLDTVRKHLSSPLPSTMAHMQQVSESTQAGQIALRRKRAVQETKDNELLQLWSGAAEIGEHNTRVALGRGKSERSGGAAPRWVDVAVNEHVFSRGASEDTW